MDEQISKPLQKTPASNRVVVPLLAIASIVAILLMAKVLARGGNNLHSHLQNWSSLNLLIQSNDPSYPEIEARTTDIRDMSAFLWPREGADARAVVLYESWRDQRNWAIFEYSLQEITYNEAGDRASVVHKLRTRYAPKVPEPGAPILERTERQRNIWIKRGRHWYLFEQTRDVEDAIEKPFQGIVSP